MGGREGRQRVSIKDKEDWFGEGSRGMGGREGVHVMFLELVTLGWQSHQDKLSKDAHGNATSGWRESRCAASVLLLRSVGSLAA